MTLGEKLAKLRKQKGYSRKEAAERSGISIASYSAYEDRRRLPKRNPEIYEKLAELYGVSVDYLKDDTQGGDYSVAISAAPEENTAEKDQALEKAVQKEEVSPLQVELQYGSAAVNLDTVLAKAREVGADSIYIKPEENTVYYVAGESNGCFPLF